MSLALHPLPDFASELLAALSAPPRLRAHLTLVHDVAVRLTKRVQKRWPLLEFDAQAVAAGAAIHDIGKAVVREELTQPGDRHEALGERLLLERGVPASVARFARTHAQWQREDASMDELLVTLADKVWKGRREDALEKAFCNRVSHAIQGKEWEVFMALDAMLEQLCADADARLAWQAEHPAG